jgi:hypothetical protein
VPSAGNAMSNARIARSARIAHPRPRAESGGIESTKGDAKTGFLANRGRRASGLVDRKGVGSGQG